MGAGMLGKRIREVRLNKKLTQNDVVGEYMTRNMLSKIENGSAAPSVKTLEYLARALEVPVSYFLEGRAPETQTQAEAQTETRADTVAPQLHLIGEIAGDMAVSQGTVCPGAEYWALCVKARALIGLGKTGDALELIGETEPEKAGNPLLKKHMYMILEDCHRERGDYKQAYEYALKRLENIN